MTILLIVLELVLESLSARRDRRGQPGSSAALMCDRAFDFDSSTPNAPRIGTMDMIGREKFILSFLSFLKTPKCWGETFHGSGCTPELVR